MTGVKTITSKGGGSVVPCIEDAFSLQIVAGETNGPLTDDATFGIDMLQNETNAEPTEEALLTFPSGGFDEQNAEPSEARSVLLRVWLSNTTGSSGVANPSNANGPNDGLIATCQTQVGGSNPEVLTSDCGVNVPAGVTFTGLLYRGWFRARIVIGTSLIRLIARSNAALFADITMYSINTPGADDNHLTGNFTFDLFAAGVNTLAKLQSLTIRQESQDAVNGVTPATLDVDAGAADITVTSI